MHKTLQNIVNAINQKGAALVPSELDKIIRARNREIAAPVRAIAKKNLLPYYQRIKAENSQEFKELEVAAELESALVQTLQVKPRRTASGVATVTVLTKPQPCSGTCIYCPNDVRMPKSYLSDEPACQRAERNFFDPYLQVAVRLNTLNQMGHTTDKVELIVLGGTWADYPCEYQIWFMCGLFSALNDFANKDALGKKCEHIRKQYESAGILCKRDEIKEAVQSKQQQVFNGSTTYSEVVSEMQQTSGWGKVGAWQTSTLSVLEALQHTNEAAQNRCVGLVVETRPSTVTPEALTLLRQLGCTKIQMGIQTLNPKIIKLNKRCISPNVIQNAFELCRAFGFKTHAHFMTNLLGATCEADFEDYKNLVENPAYKPDEVKLYPCALVNGTGLVAHYNNKTWQPYTEQQLINLLANDVEITPAFMRISRMIRDISAHDIMCGNKKVNLRQLVDLELQRRGSTVNEIRSREIAFGSASAGELSLNDVCYETSNTQEHFLQWVTESNHIAGFLRLSLPKPEYIRKFKDKLPVHEHQAMIREVHVYGKVAGIAKHAQNAQHKGLGAKLIERACEIAKQAGYAEINVISAVGTRNYYRRRGFGGSGLYQTRKL